MNRLFVKEKTYQLEYHKTAWVEIELTHKFNPYLEEHVKELSPSLLVKPRKRADFRVFTWLMPDRSRKKLDEFSAQLTTIGMDVGVITESWLHSYIDSAYISIPGNALYRRDRPDREGGGVCAFVTTGIPCKRRTDLEHPVFECMWLWLRPHRLPCPLSGIICGIVYFPEALAQENRDRLSYLV